MRRSRGGQIVHQGDPRESGTRDGPGQRSLSTARNLPVPAPSRPLTLNRTDPKPRRSRRGTSLGAPHLRRALRQGSVPERGKTATPASVRQDLSPVPAMPGDAKIRSMLQLNHLIAPGASPLLKYSAIWHFLTNARRKSRPIAAGRARHMLHCRIPGSCRSSCAATDTRPRGSDTDAQTKSLYELPVENLTHAR